MYETFCSCSNRQLTRADDEDKQGMARNLFTSITYDLDTQRIVDFKLKPWADRFITLRTALYEDENAEFEGNKNPSRAERGLEIYLC